MKWEDIKNRPVGDVLGQIVKFENPKTRRLVKAKIKSISRYGAKIKFGKKGLIVFFYWQDLHKVKE